MGTFSRQRVAELAAKAGVTEQDMADELVARKHTVEPTAQAAPPDTLPVPEVPVMDDGGGGVPWGHIAGAGGLAVLGGAATRIPAVVRQMSREPGFAGAMARGTRAFFGREPRAPGAAPPGDVMFQQPQAAVQPETVAPLERGSAASRIEEAKAMEAEERVRKMRAQADAAEAKRDRDAAGRFKPEKGQAKSRLAEPSASNIRSLEKLQGPKPEPPRGTAASRVPGIGKPDFTAGSRHEVQHFSKTRKTFVPIETMHISNLRNAVNEAYAELATLKGRPSPIKQKEFKAMMDEITYRAQQAGELTVPGPVGKAQTRAAAEFEDKALARALGKAKGAGKLLRKAGGAAAALPLILALPEIARAEERDRRAGVPKDERANRILDMVVGKLFGPAETAGKESEAPDIPETREFPR